MSVVSARLAGNLLALALLACSARVAWAAPPPAEAFGRIPQVEEVEISPNGKFVAWGDNSGATQAVQIFDLDQQKTVRVVAVDSGLKLRRIYWADNETVLFVVSVTTNYGNYRGRKQIYEVFRTLAADIAGGPARILLMAGDQERGLVSGSNLLALRTPKPKTVVMWTWDYAHTKYREEIGTRISGQRKDSGWVASVFEVDTRSGKGELIMQGSQFTDDWIVDRTGQPVARADYDPKTDTYTVRANIKGAWRDVHRQVGEGGLVLAGLTSDGTAAIVIGSLGTDRDKLWAIPLDGSGSKILVEDTERDVEAAMLDPYTWDTVGARFGGISSDVRWLDTKLETQHQALARAFPNQSARIISRSEDGKRVIVRARGLSSPVKYYLVDFTAKTAEIVGEEYPTLADEPLG
jgi:hypothetical protein